MTIEAIVEPPEPKRFPREAEDGDLMNIERARLEAEAFRLFHQRDKVRLELGRTFIRIKATFKHGHWTEAYYAQTFGTVRVTFRTVQRWMQKARRADAESEKRQQMSLLKPATDEGALKVDAATAVAEEETGRHSLQKPNAKRARVGRPALYRVPLPFTDGQRIAMDKLRASEHWPEAAKRYVELSQQLFVEFGIVSSDPDGGSNPE